MLGRSLIAAETAFCRLVASPRALGIFDRAAQASVSRDLQFCKRVLQ
jgi:hypothetical protein